MKTREEAIDNLVHGKRRKVKEGYRKTGCSAGASCRWPEGELRYGDNNGTAGCNASKCVKCSGISHDCCSYLWNVKVFCLHCFKEEVKNTCSMVETFKALLEKNKHQNLIHEVHTIGEQDLQSSVDEYL